MARVTLVDLESPDNPALEEYAAAVTSESQHFRAEAHFPEIMYHVFVAKRAIIRNGDLGYHLITKLSVAISLANQCRYCTHAFSRHLRNHLGDNETVGEFHQAVLDGTLDGKDGDVIDFALTILENPHAITDDDFTYLRGKHDFSDKTFVELIYIVNIISGYNRFTLTTDLTHDEPYPSEWIDPQEGIEVTAK